MYKKLFVLLIMMIPFCSLWATDGYVKVVSSNNTTSWVKIKLEYKYNGNQYKVSSNAIDRNTEGAVDLDNVWSESGGTGNQYIIIELDYCAFYDCSKITSVKSSSTSFVSIYGQAFQGCTSLKSVSIPYAQSLGSSSFAYCSSLTSVTLNNIYRIDSGAFYYCSALTSFNIPSGVRIIERNPFQGCTSLTNLTIASSNIYFTIDNGVLYSKDLTTLLAYLPAKAGTSFYVPSTITKIGESAFMGNRNLSTVIMRNGVKTIGESAFNNTNIQSIYLSGSITSIGNAAFYNSNKLNSVKAASSIPITISNNVFSNAGNVTLYVPQGSKDAYENAENWKTFSLIEEYPNGNVINFTDAKVKEICVSNWDLDGDGELDENEAKEVEELGIQFQNNTEITSFDELQYFTNLQTIAASAFSGCTNLSSVIVPSSVSEIGYNAFYNTAWLNAQPNGLLYIGKVLYAYRGTMPQNTKITVKDGTTSICDYAFNYQTGLVEIELPNSLVSIGSELQGYVFNGCTGLTAIKIPEGVKNIVRYAFSSSGLKSVELPAGLESIGNSSFRSCTSLESIVIPNRVTTIGKNTFRSCSKLKSVTMPYYLQTVATDAFRDCSQLQAVYISNLGGWCNVDFADYRANPLTFAHHLYLNGNELTDLVIPSNYYNGSGYDYNGQWSGSWYYNMTTVKPLVFYGCNNIKTVTIPSNITSIGNNAFSGCASLAAVKVEAAPFELTANAFPTKANVSLYAPSGYANQFRSADVWKTFKTIKAYPDADVNNDNNIDVVDVVDVLRYTNGNPSSSFDLLLADVTSDKNIDVNDAKQIMNRVGYSTTLTTLSPASDAPSNSIKIGGMELRARKTCASNIVLANASDNLVGFQMDMTLPEGLSLNTSTCRLSSRRVDQEQTLVISNLGNNTFRFSSVSYSLQPIAENDGELIALSFDASNLTSSGNITISNIRFVTSDSERLVLTDCEVEVQPVEYVMFCGGDGTEENPYQIVDANDFVNLAKDVNGGTSYEGTFFKVVKPEIDFSGVTYTAIGQQKFVSNNIVINPFAGSFDGNNVIIKNLSASNGIFGYLAKKGTVADIVIDESCKINGSTADVAGIAGTSKGTISNCINKASVSGSYHVGGICGDNMGTIVNCKNYGAINSTNTDCSMAGGIAGDVDGGKIQNCENYGSVTGVSWAVGGIVGLVTGSNCLIDGCLNKGNLTGKYSVGGIFGNGTNTPTVISNNLVANCTINGTNGVNTGAYGTGAIGTSSYGLSNNYYTADVIVKVGDQIYDGDTPRGVWSGQEPQDITSNSGAMLFIKGDADGDKSVDIADAVSVVNYVVGKPNATFIEAAADVDGDGVVDIADAVRIVNLVVGKISALAPEFHFSLPEPQ